jgi:nicotinamidase-related amidase
MLLVMDMLNDLVHEDGGGAKTYVPLMKQRNVLARTRATIDKARAAGVPIGYVRVGFSPDYRECPPNSPIFSRAPGRRDVQARRLGHGSSSRRGSAGG